MQYNNEVKLSESQSNMDFILTTDDRICDL